MADQQIPKIGEDVTALMASDIGADVTALMASHEPEQPPAEHPHARTWRKVKENAPMIGAAAASLAGPGGIIPSVLLAGGGGFLGARLRGDSREDAAAEGVMQGGLQGAGGLAVKGGQAVARGIMRGAIPKPVQADFGGKAIAQEALDTFAIPGSERSAARISNLSNQANQARDAAAQNVPRLPSRKIIDGLRKLHDDAVAAKMPERARAVVDRAGEIRREVGAGLDGPGMLARKGILQQESKAALNAANPKMAAVGPQIANAERDAIVSHLRETTGMEQALNLSQRRMGLDRFMQDSLTSNMINRLGMGPANALKSPMGLGVAAHVVNQGSRALDPNTVRALMLLLSQRSSK